MSKSGVNETLKDAILKRKPNQVKTILKKNSFLKESLKNSPYQGLYLTHYAVLSQSSQILEFFLMEEKMNPNLTVERSKMAVLLQNPRIEIVDGDTCLHIAARLLNFELVAVLLNHGKIDVCKKNKREQTASEIHIPNEDVRHRLEIQNEILKKEVLMINQMKSKVSKLETELKLLQIEKVESNPSVHHPSHRRVKTGLTKRNRHGISTEPAMSMPPSVARKKNQKRFKMDEINRLFDEAEEGLAEMDVHGKRFVEGLIMLLNPLETMKKLEVKSVRQSNHRELIRFKRVFESSSKILNSAAFSRLRGIFEKLVESGTEFNQESIGEAKNCLLQLIKEDKLRKSNAHKIHDLFEMFVMKATEASNMFLKLKDLNHQIELQREVDWLKKKDKEDIDDEDLLLLDNDDDDDESGLFPDEAEEEKKEKEEKPNEGEGEKKMNEKPSQEEILKSQYKDMSEKCFRMKRELEFLKLELVELEYCYEKRRREALRKMDSRLKRLNQVNMKENQSVDGKKCQAVLTKFEREARVLYVFRSESDYKGMKNRIHKGAKMQELECEGLEGGWMGSKRTVLFFLDDEMEDLEKQVEDVESFVNGELKKGNVDCLFKFEYLRDEYLGVELKEGDFVPLVEKRQKRKRKRKKK